MKKNAFLTKTIWFFMVVLFLLSVHNSSVIAQARPIGPPQPKPITQFRNPANGFQPFCEATSNKAIDSKTIYTTTGNKAIGSKTFYTTTSNAASCETTGQTCTSVPADVMDIVHPIQGLLIYIMAADIMRIIIIFITPADLINGDRPGIQLGFL